MPALGDDGSVYTMKKVEGEKVNVCILQCLPAKGGKGQNKLVLTDEGEEWIVEEMAGGATIDEVIALLGISSQTLYSRNNNLKVKRAVEKGTEMCNRKLRKAQVNAALNGNSAMLIWLGKNRLGQSEHPETAEEASSSPVDDYLMKALEAVKED